MVSLVNPHTNATSNRWHLSRWHLWEIDLRFALNSTPGWIDSFIGNPLVRIHFITVEGAYGKTCEPTRQWRDTGVPHR